MRRIVIALLCLASLGGCAAPGQRPSPAGAAASTGWVTYQADVTAVRVGGDPRSLVLSVALLAGDEGCSRDPRITYLTEENNRIYANVVQDSLLSQVVGACPTHTMAEVTLIVRGRPVDSRIVVLNQEPWKRDGDRYRRCDATFGCDPMPANHCDRAWIDVVVRGMDVSRHSTGAMEGCDGRWLVMTVPFDPQPCGAEARPGCSPSVNVRRYFLRWSGQPGWAIVASSTTAGCGTVRTVQPAFPRNLCAGLPRP
jgi:hypothetical protein